MNFSRALAARRSHVPRLPAETAPLPRARRLQHARRQLRLVSSLTLLIAIRLRSWLGGYLFLTFGLFFQWQFDYLTVAIRRFYLARGQW